MSIVRIALAAPRIFATVDDGLARVARLMADASRQGARIVCYPEAYLPGLRGQDFDVPGWTMAQEHRVLHEICELAREHRIAVIAGIEHLTEQGSHVAAVVIDAAGEVQGWQLKCQLDPSEDAHYTPGTGRSLFELGGLRFGVVICHEGWRYPETVRWAAVRGAHVVFHPHLTGSDRTGPTLTTWGASENPYYEQAMRMRSRENTIYFASVNYALQHAESATSVIDPSGERVASLPYGQEGVLVADIDCARATGLLASRFRPERYGEAI